MILYSVNVKKLKISISSNRSSKSNAKSPGIPQKPGLIAFTFLDCPKSKLTVIEGMKLSIRAA